MHAAADTLSQLLALHYIAANEQGRDEAEQLKLLLRRAPTHQFLLFPSECVDIRQASVGRYTSMGRSNDEF